MPEHLLDKKRITLGLVVNRLGKLVRRCFAAKPREQVRYLRFGPPPQCDPVRVPLARQLLERARERAVHLQLHVAVSPDGEGRQL